MNQVTLQAIGIYIATIPYGVFYIIIPICTAAKPYKGNGLWAGLRITL